MRVINPAIGRRLAAIRRHRMWFLAELADAIGVTKGTITHYEQGRAEIKLSRLEQIAVALRCRVDDLLASENAAPPRITRRQRRAPTPRG
jgi:transcriptional regulator with XRE-family HTH domain